jgi:pectate lyase
MALVTIILVLVLSPPALSEGFSSTPSERESDRTAEVISLDDSGPGTLRRALTKSKHRIIFKVGGTINLRSRLKIQKQSFITVDGSTAPAPGITLRGHGIQIRDSHDIKIRHIRVRNSISDGFSIRDGVHNIALEQCSATDSADENISITNDARKVAVTWCIIGDSRPESFELKTRGMLIASFDRPPVTYISLHHNLFVNESQRSPQISTPGLFDIRNNVIWNWKAYGIRIRNGAWGNIVNNVFATTENPQKAIVLVVDGKRNAGRVYIHGNQGPQNTNINSLSTATNRFNFDMDMIPTDPAADVEQKVLKAVGAFPRDVIDSLVITTRKN